MNIKLAIAQINPRCGDVSFNRNLIYNTYMKTNSEIIVFPESSLTGYPNEDLVLNHDFMNIVEQSRKELIDDIYNSGKTTAIIFGSPERKNNKIYNGAYFIDPVLKTTQKVYKTELPNYGVFDEKRIYTPNRYINCVSWRDINIGLMICEDAWHERVCKELYADCAHLFISINGSPFEVDKQNIRKNIVYEHAKKYKTPFVYVNMVGGQDEIVFDGNSFAVDGNGKWHNVGPFIETIQEIDLSINQIKTIKNPTTFIDNISEVYQALVLGTRDYLGKQNFKTTLIGYSGGVDSGLVAAISCDAIGADNTHLVRLPSKYSSQGSLDDALKGAERLGAPLRTIPIEPVVEALRTAYGTMQYDQGYAKDIVSGDHILKGVADENIQARARGNILSAISNQEGQILLTTGNKSEVSVGYFTIFGGDSAGGYNPIKDCYKTLVWELCKWRNALSQEEITNYGFQGREGIIVPEEIINKPPSAELRADQKDSDSLPPYPILDGILKNIIEEDKSNDEIVSLGYDIETVKRIRWLVYNSEYKRRQSAPGIKITSKLHGRDRRFPIVNGILKNN